MRLNNSIKNIIMSFIVQVTLVFFGFLTRKIFLDNLGVEYLGVNGLLTNVVSMLGLAEMGIGASIIYNLYKPLAEKNEVKIVALIQLYKKIYNVLALIVLVLSLGLYPFLNVIMKGKQEIRNLNLIYFLFVGRNIISYLYAYKFSLINADQKSYILGKSNLFFQIVMSLTKIFILLKYKDYIVFLILEIILFIIQNIYSSKIVEKIYPYIKTKNKYDIDIYTKNNIIKNVKAIFLHNIGTYCVFGTDNLLISYFINVSAVGLYSNYSMLINQINKLATPVFEGIGASIGNLIVTESKEKNYFIFRITYLINFFLYSILVICLFNLVEPFIYWWLGDDLILNKLTFIILLLNFYITGMRASISMFKYRGGIFHEDRYMPLIEAVINLGTSIVLVKYFGLAGIFMGTTVSTLSIVFWNAPRLVYKNIFEKPVINYFYQYILYGALTVILALLTSKITRLFFLNNSFVSLVKRGMISFLIPLIVYIIIFSRTEELKYLKNILQKKYKGK